MRTILTTLCLVIILSILSGCGTAQLPGLVLGKKAVQKTQLEIRQMQTRTYEVKDKTLLMKAMLNVLEAPFWIDFILPYTDVP